MNGVPTVAEPPACISRRDCARALRDGGVESLDRACSRAAEVRLELRPGEFDGVEVGRVGREVDRRSPHPGERLRDPGDLLCSRVVQHHGADMAERPVP